MISIKLAVICGIMIKCSMADADELHVTLKEE